MSYVAYQIISVAPTVLEDHDPKKYPTKSRFQTLTEDYNAAASFHVPFSVCNYCTLYLGVCTNDV